MLEVFNLSFDYSDKPLLSNVNFLLQPGHLLHLTGVNGSGKSTLLKLIAGLRIPASGLIKYNETLAYVGHKSGVPGHLTLQQYCKYLQGFYDCTTAMDSMLTDFNMAHILDKKCDLLSSGQLRKAALLRLFYSGARIWLLDEPLVALDRAAVEVFQSEMQQHLQQGGVIVLVSHQTFVQGDSYLEYKL